MDPFPSRQFDGVFRNSSEIPMGVFENTKLHRKSPAVALLLEDSFRDPDPLSRLKHFARNAVFPRDQHVLAKFFRVMSDRKRCSSVGEHYVHTCYVINWKVLDRLTESARKKMMYYSTSEVFQFFLIEKYCRECIPSVPHRILHAKVGCSCVHHELHDEFAYVKIKYELYCNPLDEEDAEKLPMRGRGELVLI
jgi:hypothetical protein